MNIRLGWICLFCLAYAGRVCGQELRINDLELTAIDSSGALRLRIPDARNLKDLRLANRFRVLNDKGKELLVFRDTVNQYNLSWYIPYGALPLPEGKHALKMELEICSLDDPKRCAVRASNSVSIRKKINLWVSDSYKNKCIEWQPEQFVHIHQPSALPFAYRAELLDGKGQALASRHETRAAGVQANLRFSYWELPLEPGKHQLNLRYRAYYLHDSAATFVERVYALRDFNLNFDLDVFWSADADSFYVRIQGDADLKADRLRLGLYCGNPPALTPVSSYNEPCLRREESYAKGQGWGFFLHKLSLSPSEKRLTARLQIEQTDGRKRFLEQAFDVKYQLGKDCWLWTTNAVIITNPTTGDPGFLWVKNKVDYYYLLNGRRHLEGSPFAVCLEPDKEFLLEVWDDDFDKDDFEGSGRTADFRAGITGRQPKDLRIRLRNEPKGVEVGYATGKVQSLRREFFSKRLQVKPAEDRWVEIEWELEVLNTQSIQVCIRSLADKKKLLFFRTEGKGRDVLSVQALDGKALLRLQVPAFYFCQGFDDWELVAEQPGEALRAEQAAFQTSISRALMQLKPVVSMQPARRQGMEFVTPFELNDQTALTEWRQELPEGFELRRRLKLQAVRTAHSFFDGQLPAGKNFALDLPHSEAHPFGAAMNYPKEGGIGRNTVHFYPGLDRNDLLTEYVLQAVYKESEQEFVVELQKERWNLPVDAGNYKAFLMEFLELNLTRKLPRRAVELKARIRSGDQILAETALPIKNKQYKQAPSTRLENKCLLGFYLEPAQSPVLELTLPDGTLWTSFDLSQLRPSKDILALPANNKVSSCRFWFHP